MNKETILGIVRHVLTGAGTLLTSKGLADSGTIETAVGALITLVSIIWSMANKKAVEKKIESLL